tara:strand:- start:42 stop:809 length:768 start_codon:yes stop_codon:yes gene_type:complete
MNALILAAGQGKRLGNLGKLQPKCLTEIFGKPIIERQIETLDNEKINPIYIVTGYKNVFLKKYNLIEFYNDQYESTNMVYSMFKANDLFKKNEEDLIISYGDIIYENNNLAKLIESDAEISIMVDLNWRKLWSIRFSNPLDDAETMKIDEGLNIIELGKKTEDYNEIQGQYTGLLKFRKDSLPKIKSHYENLKSNIRDYKNLFMTDFIQLLIDSGLEVKAVPVFGGWLEIDTENDIKCYEKLIESKELNEYYRIQ